MNKNNFIYVLTLVILRCRLLQVINTNYKTTGKTMKTSELEKTLTSALNKLAQPQGQQLKPGQYRKTSAGYIGRRKNGTYCSAFTLTEINGKTQ